MRDVTDAIVAALAARPNSTMAELAELAGTSRATLHRRFPSREHLLISVAEQAAAVAERAVAGARPTEGSALDACARIVTELVPVGARFAFLLREGSWLDEVPPVARAIAAVADSIDAVVRRGRHAGELRVDLPASFQARLMLGVVLTTWEAVEAGELGRVEAPDAAVTAVLSGIQARP